eukprot:GFYU01013112.1.p1 GENE.GFYU01013112.1~~GFYU01013112.1.p1  ORF type:complete len:158 (+),score=53.99 GFYU01013112.1:62-535(+)
MSGTMDDVEQELRGMFDMIDADGSGVIDQEEMKDLLRMLGMEASASDVEKLLKEADEDQSGTVDFGEFMSIMTKSQAAGVDKFETMHAFRVLKRLFPSEANIPDDQIHYKHLQRAIYAFGGEHTPEARQMAEEMALMMEPNEDGVISFADMVKALVQ